MEMLCGTFGGSVVEYTEYRARIGTRMVRVKFNLELTVFLYGIRIPSFCDASLKLL